MLAKIKICSKKWLIRFYNAGKMSGNILTFVVICLLFLGTLFGMCNRLETIGEIDIGKGDTIPKILYYVISSVELAIWFYCAWKLAPRLFKVQKLFIHLLYWLGALCLIITMYFFSLMLSVIF